MEPPDEDFFVSERRAALSPKTIWAAVRRDGELAGLPPPARPAGSILFAAFRRLRHGRKTRYGWVGSPCPTGTFTPQEAPS